MQRKHAQFQEVKKCLQRLKISYAVLYLAYLQVMAGCRAHFSETARDAADWLDANEACLRPPNQAPED